jgi:putative NADH-flavin reductase
MKIIIFGATGPSGQQLVIQGLELGHQVTAFARNPSAIRLQHERLNIVRGDIRDALAVETYIQGQHAVLSALGVRKLRRNSILSDGTRNILSAMIRLGIRRFICETSLGVGDSKNDLGKMFTWFFIPVLLKNAFADKEIQEEYIRQSGIDWTIVRPAYLDNGPRTGNYLVWTGRKPAEATNRISRADVAHFMLKQLVTDTYVKKTPGISY